jgi:hypothetical protein
MFDLVHAFAQHIASGGSECLGYGLVGHGSLANKESPFAILTAPRQPGKGADLHRPWRALVRAAFFAAIDRPAAPLVFAAFRAAALR